MKKLAGYFFLIFICCCNIANAQQRYEYVQQGEYGFSVGVAHYFGDLNTRARINRPKPAIGAFYRKQFGNYVGLRVSAHFAQVGYSDIYSNNAYQKQRNLSFNSNIFELALHGDFNFLKFVPGDLNYRFTPYITIGAGIFNFNPYAYLHGQKVFLQPIGTEGQNIRYLGRKPYNTMAFCFPVGTGVKYNLTEKINLSFEVALRFTTTDYLDDVSTTYVGVDKFPLLPNGQPSIAAQLQDRSTEINSNKILGVEGAQRGFSQQKDQYVIAEFGISFNISSYRCPSAK